MKFLNLKCVINSWSGYGRLSADLIKGFLDYGLEVKVNIISFDDQFPLPQTTLSRITDKNLDNLLVISTPDFNVDTLYRFGIYSMWETTRPKKHWIKGLNYASFAAFPNDWNLNNFSAGGIVCPMYVVPLYVDENFKFLEPIKKDVFVFGFAGNLESGGDRKGIETTISSFLSAFPNEKNVELHLKTEKSIPFEIKDNRIKITSKYLTDEELLEWYRGIDIFVNGSKSECWGFFVIQAMACGKPVISIKHGGIAEYFDESCGLVIPHQYEEAKYIWKYHGVFPKIDEEELAKNLKFAYENQNIMLEKGIVANKKVQKFTLENTVTEFVKLCEKYELINGENTLNAPSPSMPIPPQNEEIISSNNFYNTHQLSPFLESFLSWFIDLSNLTEISPRGVQFIEISPRTNSNLDIKINGQYILFILEPEIKNEKKLKDLIKNAALVVSNINIPEVFGIYAINFIYWESYVDVETFKKDEFQINNNSKRKYKILYAGNNQEFKNIILKHCNENQFEYLELKDPNQINPIVLNEIEYILFDDKYTNIIKKNDIATKGIACGCRILNTGELGKILKTGAIQYSSIEDVIRILNDPFEYLDDLTYRRIIYAFDIDVGLGEAITRLEAILKC